jgi:hypothetical protein
MMVYAGVPNDHRVAESVWRLWTFCIVLTCVESTLNNHRLRRSILTHDLGIRIPIEGFKSKNIYFKGI